MYIHMYIQSPPLIKDTLRNRWGRIFRPTLFRRWFWWYWGCFRTGRNSGKPLLLPVLKKPPPVPPKPPTEQGRSENPTPTVSGGYRLRTEKTGKPS